ncbi:MAG: phosphotransferase [Clostridia bacterium]|nr:phosphotransferase [Clostridia bacterium]
MYSNKNIDFLIETDELIEVTGGHSGAHTYKVVRDDDTFFLKVASKGFSQKKVMELKDRLMYYKEMPLKAIELIDIGLVKDEEMHYIAYEYVDGVNLKDEYNKDEYSLKDNYELGVNIGEAYAKLKEFKGYNESICRRETIMDHIELINDSIDVLTKDNKLGNLFKKDFSVDEIENIRSLADEYGKAFKNSVKCLIHGDIKRSNFMKDNEDNIYTVDCESIGLDYDVLNFRYQIIWGILREKEKAFVRGYFDGLYNFSRPEGFNEMFRFTVLLCFFNSFAKRVRRNQYEKGIEEYKSMKDLIKNIRELTL